MPLRIIFMGTPDFSVPFLTEILGQGHEVVAVYSQPPRPGGRGMKEKKSPVHEKAEALGIPVFTPKSLRTPEAQEEFASHNADVAVVVAYGVLLPKPILEAPRLGCYNGHASLLPRWRGAAPIQRAIMSGDGQSGIMIMKMDEGLDTGPVAMAESLPITDDMTAADLHDKLAQLGGNLLVRALMALELGQLTLTEQPEEGVTYAEKIDKGEARVDWSMPAQGVLRHIHGLSPFPGSWCEMELGGKPVRVKLLRAEHAGSAPGRKAGEVIDDALGICCGDGNAIRITKVQRAGKQVQDVQEFLRGNAVPSGTILA